MGTFCYEMYKKVDLQPLAAQVSYKVSSSISAPMITFIRHTGVGNYIASSKKEY